MSEKQYPISDLKYGDVLKEEWLETASGTKRVAVIKTKDGTSLCIQSMYVDRATQELKFGKAVRLPTNDGTAEDVLNTALVMLQQYLIAGHVVPKV